jgi:RNA polymerase sigma factor (TIGR02999 family)
MTSDPPLRSQATALLITADSGDGAALDRLVPLVYDELRALARRHLAREHRQQTLQTTALVHEAYLKLVDDTRVTRRGRAYFFAAAARAMRQVLVDRARKRNAARRGGVVPKVSLDEEQIAAGDFVTELLDLDRALEQLAELNSRCAQVVDCRFFAGMSVEETAEALDVSPRTVKYDWALARAWLFDALHGEDGKPTAS